MLELPERYTIAGQLDEIVKGKQIEQVVAGEFVSKVHLNPQNRGIINT